LRLNESRYLRTNVGEGGVKNVDIGESLTPKIIFFIFFFRLQNLFFLIFILY
jgi:hypothetical protein